jgi:hypothetical protein
MTAVSEAEPRDRGASARRLLEALLFALGSVGVLGAGSLVMTSTGPIDDYGLARLVMAASSVIAIGGIASIAFVAGWRKSPIDLIATLAGFIVYVAYAWGPWFSAVG